VQRRGFSPLMPAVYHAPYPKTYRYPPGMTPEQWVAYCLDYIDHELFGQLVSPDEVAAIVVEPIQGEGGYVIAPDAFMRGLRELTSRHGILLVADEVQSGMGRTGKMFAIEHTGVQPDVVAIAKGIASGLPLGVAAARSDLMQWPAGAHASTFGGNPIACAAALATIELLKGGLMANAATVGAHLKAGLEGLMTRHPIIGDVRGRGLMIGVELVRDRVTKERAVTERDKIVDACFARGLLLLGAGKNSIRISPPLVLTKAQAETAVRIIDEAMTELS
jgi:4-aminobutyrate aminotransferase